MTGKKNSNNVGREVARVHFVLMAGYRLFSLYYPLFLAAQGFSLAQIGNAYLFIYLPIALGAPLAGFLTRLIHPALMVAAGCFGYAAYALGMVFFGGVALAYAWQIMLGLSAALFFTACRALLMADRDGGDESNFSWFYNAPYWAGAIAPAAGAFIIWKFGFSAAFQISAAVCVYAALLALAMASHSWRFTSCSSVWIKFVRGWRASFKCLASKTAGPLIAASFTVALAESLVHPFFVLFLKDQIGLDKNQVLQFVALSAAVFSIFYFLVLKRWQNGDAGRSITRGGLISASATVAFGFLMPVLSYASAFLIEFGRGVGGFLAGTGRSALLAKEMKNRPSEGGALDTIFSPLSIALGSFIGGYAITWLGYQWLFLISGAAVLAAVLLLKNRG
jgi:predicted MFS family arabinose efflux permease